MTRQEADAVTRWRSNPLTSKTMWTIYVSIVSLTFIGWKVIETMGERTPTSVILSLIAAFTALGITGVAGLTWTDPALAAMRLWRAPPDVEAVYTGQRASTPPRAP